MKLKGLIFSALTVFSLVIVPLTGSASESLKIVENDKVCMVTDMHFPKKQIPVTVGEKTYYGCCQNCKATLTNDAKARTAVDPVSGKSVDKAKAVIAMRPDHSVVYFENEKNFKQYAKQGNVTAPASDSHAGHSGH